MTLKFTAAPGAGVPLAVTVTATVYAVLTALVPSAGASEQATTGGTIVRHRPELPALKVPWISAADRARLKIWTSSIKPLNRRGPKTGWLPICKGCPLANRVTRAALVLSGLPFTYIFNPTAESHVP